MILKSLPNISDYILEKSQKCLSPDKWWFIYHIFLKIYIQLKIVKMNSMSQQHNLDAKNKRDTVLRELNT